MSMYSNSASFCGEAMVDSLASLWLVVCIKNPFSYSPSLTLAAVEYVARSVSSFESALRAAKCSLVHSSGLFAGEKAS